MRQQCLYLRKSYEIVVQRMNLSTWEECICIAINELEDCGIVGITNNRTVMLVNLQFRKNEQLTVPYAQTNREPKLFSIFPEARKKFMYFCNQKINDGSLSTELVWSEVRDHISRDYYNNLLKEVHYEVPPTFD